VDAVGSHSHGLEPLFDVAPDSIVDPTAQIVPRGHQIVARIGEKSRFGDIVFLGEPVQERPRIWAVPWRL